MHQPLERTGFAPPPRRPHGRDRRSVALAALLAAMGLALGTIVAATIVTAGMAHG